MKRGRAAVILDEVRAAVETWAACAEAAGVDEVRREQIRGAHRMAFAEK